MQSSGEVVRGARLFVTYLRDTSIISTPAVEPPIHDPALLTAFCQWMRQQRGTCDVTLYTYRIYIRELLRRLERSQAALMLAGCERFFSRRVAPVGCQQPKIAPR
jgi:hypothetical protein